ncbi:hypothetical protein E2C06_19515 [Dankookia rubra]|uniref:Secreted protein n=1 Tax=Dankookia rubra TaxID=1442381 RepID=A0A4R5QET5_9PROT|nr:hypothetical protein [Dankookia rubra]TDH60927.1 hypothetical protein E2C06_19515 [Dankookia rubra]
MRNVMVSAAMAVLACSVMHPARAQPAAQAQEQSAANIASGRDGLGDLEKMTFDCPRAGLNAAAREASKHPSQGSYQFAYFKIINGSHHSSYEIAFQSNQDAEPELKYCVSVYCQQGWDPASKTSVTLMPSGRPPKGASAHVAACGRGHAPVKR